jgi:hypothetical protein
MPAWLKRVVAVVLDQERRGGDGGAQVQPFGDGGPDVLVEAIIERDALARLGAGRGGGGMPLCLSTAATQSLKMPRC